ncbi:hypothetical protein [Cetobacterium sp.]|uniref:hypothetical protein n=1 Tax=Cetobacterium sp. TaxID=2071632 RepID=UPI002FC787E9
MYKKLLDNGFNIQLFGGPEPSPTPEPSPEPTPEPSPTPEPNPEPTPQPNPADDWGTIKPESFKNINQDDITVFLEKAKNDGISPAVALHQLNARENYLSTQREAMTPELRELDPVIQNFIEQDENKAYKDVISRLAENAQGRKFLQEKLLTSNGGTVNLMDKGGLGKMTHEEFVTKYNEAYDAKKSGDSSKMNQLESYARNSEDDYYRDFLMLDK